LLQDIHIDIYMLGFAVDKSTYLAKYIICPINGQFGNLSCFSFRKVYREI